jgi:ComF family protein
MSGDLRQRGFFDELLDLVYPPSLYCVCCGNLIDDTRTYGLCDHCIRHIMWDREPPEYYGGLGSRAVQCAQYGIYDRAVIFSLKYRKNRYVSRNMAEIMKDRLALTGFSPDVIVPVPVSPKRLRERGFNHMELVGRHMSEMTGIDMVPDALVRVKDTRPMRGLDPQQRRDNMAGAVAPGRGAADKIRGRSVLLIDDILTTGATAGVCVDALMSAGPEDVMFMAFSGRMTHAKGFGDI